MVSHCSSVLGDFSNASNGSGESRVFIKGGETSLQQLYKSVAKEISKPPFLAPEVQWASKFTLFVRFTFPLNFSNHAHIWYVT